VRWNLSQSHQVPAEEKPTKFMSLNKGPIVLVDDDLEDQELIQLSLQGLALNREVKMFADAEGALKFLYETHEQPFIIISDVNMPKMNGISFKRKIDDCQTLRAKCIPFVFLSTSTKRMSETCDLNIQGYFEKGNSIEQLRDTMNIIFQYWERTKHIN
jgi:two-component SAPR family response regulator